MVQGSRRQRIVSLATRLTLSRVISLFALCLFLCAIVEFFPAQNSTAQAESRIDCNVINSRILKQVVHYCVLVPASYDSAASSTQYPVLYFLHGLGENEQALFKSGGWDLVEDLRQQHKIGDFLIVTPEAKGSFYINSADGKVRYSDFFVKEFIPYIESKYRIKHERSARAISGISMGGYGALRFAFAYPELFSSVSAQSAALIAESPKELESELDSEFESSGPNRLLASVFGDPTNIPHWNQNNPLLLAKQNKQRVASLAIYFNCGQDDDFGFEVGANALDKQLKSEGIKHEFHLYPGTHSPQYFLKHLEETMEFHSRVFAAGR
ncbi:MAG TPA: alpha/beta hydrolase family protein [Terriglobales bacterium]|nr:alpha/beta hydrolase family protein [Terriglobales bacterium]